MWKDPIVEELHLVREALAQQHGNDLHAIVLHFQRLEAKSARQVMNFAPKRPFGWRAPLVNPAPRQ